MVILTSNDGESFSVELNVAKVKVPYPINICRQKTAHSLSVSTDNKTNGIVS